jgi:predicted metal-dependent hydrolase
VNLLLFKKFPFSETFHLEGGRVVRAEIRLNRGGRTMRMRMSKDHQSVIITVPRFIYMSAIKRFVDGHADWLERNYNVASSVVSFAPGAIVPVLGKPTLLEIAPPRTKTRLIEVDGAQNYQARLIIASPEINFAEKTRVALRKMSLQKAQEFVDEFAPKLNRIPAKVAVRDTKSRWGSCNSKGNLMFAWRLIFAPEMVFKEVVAHELAHLKEMNHSRAFYAELERLMPDYKKYKDWLKQNGRGLHLIG